MHENENLFPTEPTLKILIVKTQLLFSYILSLVAALFHET